MHETAVAADYEKIRKIIPRIHLQNFSLLFPLRRLTKGAAH